MRISQLFRSLSEGFSSPRQHRRKSKAFNPVSAEQLELRQLLVAQITQLSDLNVAPETGSSDPQELTQVGNTLFFTALDKTHGRELWKKEGTSAAVLVKDVRAGSENSGLGNLTAVGSTLFFSAHDGIHGAELWKSDGTTAGTMLVIDTLGENGTDPAEFGYGSGPAELRAFNGKLYYHANIQHGNPNPTLMVSDGTSAGTHMVKDSYLNVPFFWARIERNSTAIGSTLLFDAWALWKTDGTSGGTSQIAPFRASNLTTVGSTAFFVTDSPANGNSELWKTDGTAGGTVMVKDIRPGDPGSSPAELTNVNGTLYFTSDDGTTGRELWKSDGTAAGTVRVRDLNAGTDPSNPTQLTAIGTNLYFSAFDSASNGYRLWKSDGTEAGTIVLNSVGSNPDSITAIGSSIYFAASEAVSGRELWKTDGTAAGTALYKDLQTGAGSSSPYSLRGINGALYYAANDGVKGNEIWRHDVTTNTAVQNDIFRGTKSSDVHDFTNVNGMVFFVRTIRNDSNAVLSEELWKCAANGTGATQLKSFLDGYAHQRIQQLTSYNGALYFTANDPVTGVELFKSDGTAAGTVVVKDIVAGAGESVPFNLTVVNGLLYFSAVDANGRELWKSDGTAAGTVMVKDITTGAADSLSYGGNFIAGAGSTVFFVANDGVNGAELWKSDGTAAGTVLVKDVWTAGTSSQPDQLFNVNGLLYFVANDGTRGRELWQSDGTAAGTVLVADLSNYEWSNTTSFRSLTNADGKLFFEYAPSLAFGWTLACRETPTSALTIISLKDSNLNGREFVNPLTAVGGLVYFNQFDTLVGSELWKSDGTVAGTVLFKDILAIPKQLDVGVPWGSDPQQLVGSNGVLYFTADDYVNGRELWMSDGTSAGTVMMANLTGDSGSSNPENLAAINGRVFLTAVTEATGREPYSVIDVFTPSTPTISSPLSVTPLQRPVISWTSSTGAVSYDVFIKNNATGANPQVSVNVVGTTSYQPTADLGIGKFSVWVRAVGASGTKSAWSAQKDFTVNTLVTSAPTVRNQTTNKPTLVWKDLPGAVKYDVWLDNTTPGQTSTVILHDIKGKSWQNATDLPLGQYRAWVRGLDASGLAAAWSSVIYFNVVTPPTMTAPLSSTFAARPQFTWNSVPSATKYDIYIRNMNTETVAYSVANITATNWTPPADLPEGTYRWQVVAASANYRGLWSNTMDFTVGGRPELIGPMGSGNDTTPTFTWKSVAGAASYQIWVDRADTYVQGIINVSGLTGASYTPTTALPVGTFRVWIRALSSTGALSDWSEHLTFTITA